MYKKLMKTIFILVSAILLLTSCNSNEVNDGPELFTDIYYEIAKDDDFIREDQLVEHLKKYDKYNMEYNEKTHSYLITDPEESEENHVYISLMYESDLFNSITYFDANKNLQVTKEFRHALKEKPIYKTHIIGDGKKEVKDIDDQIKFLKETINEDYKKIKDNSYSDNPTQLKFDISYEILEGKLKPILKTNLPNNTKGIFSLTSDELDYRASSNFEIKDGIAMSDIFTKQGEALEKGNYVLEATLPLSSIQESDVELIVGIDYSNYIGDNIKEDAMGVYVEDSTDIIIN